MTTQLPPYQYGGLMVPHPELIHADALNGLEVVEYLVFEDCPKLERLPEFGNLVGIVTPGPRIPAALGNVVIYRDGVPLAPIAAAPGERPRAVAAVSGAAM